MIDPSSGEVVPDGHPGDWCSRRWMLARTVVLRYRTGDFIEGGLTWEPCPYCSRRVPRLVGNISRSSEVKTMQLDKIKGTLVDFNELEHLLDDVEHIGAWQLELRKYQDDPLEVDELILHVQKQNGIDEQKLVRDLRTRCIDRTEIQPNRIQFHSGEEMRQLQASACNSIAKIVDNRPNATKRSVPAPGGELADGPEHPDAVAVDDRTQKVEVSP